MRRLLDFLILFTLFFSIASCEKDNATAFEEPQLIVIESEVIFDAQGGAGFIKLSAPGAVKATSDVDWCQVVVSGMGVNLQVEENLSYVGRTATVTIESGGEKVDVTAVQKARVFWLKDLRESTISFLSEGSSVETEVVSPFPIEVVEKPDWLHYRFEGNMLYLTADPGSPRKGKIVFKSEGRVLEYNIVQSPFIGVRTIAGIFGKNQAIDGPALEASFQRPAKIASDIDGSNLIVVDDYAHKIRLVSQTDNSVVTVASVQNPFPVVFNTQYDKCFIGIRANTRRPELFVALSKEDNYRTPVMYYDQKDDQGNYLFGNSGILNIAADDTYVYLMSTNGTKLSRIHQETGKVEIIGENLELAGIIYLTFNTKDKKIYVMSESTGILNRFDPYYIPPGGTIPWISKDEVEYVLGNGVGAAIEGIGRQARCPCVEIRSDQEGYVYGCDINNHVIWKFDVIKNEATILAGIPRSQGHKDGPELMSMFDRPLGLTITSSGVLYVADTNNYLIRGIFIH